MGQVRIPETLNCASNKSEFPYPFGGKCDLRKEKGISQSVWGEMGRVWVSKKMKFPICWGGNGASPGLRTIEFLNQIGRTWCKSRFQKIELGVQKK